VRGCDPPSRLIAFTTYDRAFRGRQTLSVVHRDADAVVVEGSDGSQGLPRLRIALIAVVRHFGRR
jgi:hypothetical protein